MAWWALKHNASCSACIASTSGGLSNTMQHAAPHAGCIASTSGGLSSTMQHAAGALLAHGATWAGHSPDRWLQGLFSIVRAHHCCLCRHDCRWYASCGSSSPRVTTSKTSCIQGKPASSTAHPQPAEQPQCGPWRQLNSVGPLVVMMPSCMPSWTPAHSQRSVAAHTC